MTNTNKLLIAVSVIATNMVAIESLSVDDVRFDDGRQQESLTIDEKVDFGRNKERQTSTYLEKVLSGEIGFSWSQNTNTKRVSYFAIVRYEDLFFDFIKAKLEYRHTTTKLQRELTRRTYADDPTLPQTKTVEKTYRSNALREAYVDINFGRYGSLSVGRQVLVWGQFEGFSPIDMVMPHDYSTGTAGMTKVQNRLPQDAVVLNLFPIENLKISGYYFPHITRDPMIEKFFENAEVHYGEETHNTRVLEQPDEDEDYQTALRIMYYGDKWTVGYTRYDGWEGYYSENEHIHPDPFRPGEYNHIPHPKVERFQSEGWEFAIPSNKWTWKFETMVAKRSLDLDHNRFSDTNTPEEQDFLDWVLNENASRFYVPVWYRLSVVGFDYSSERWDTNFLMFNINEDIAGDEYEKRYKQSYDINGQNYKDSLFPVWLYIPFIHTARYFDDEKSSAIGAGFGIYGDSFKAFTYFKDTIDDSFSYGISYEYTQIASDAELEDNNYELTSTGGAGRVFGLYKF